MRPAILFGFVLACGCSRALSPDGVNPGQPDPQAPASTQPALSACEFSDATPHPVVAFASGLHVQLLRSDRSVTTLYTWQTSSAEGWLEVMSSAQKVLVVGHDGHTNNDVRLLDLSGHEIWHYSGKGLPQIGPDATTVIFGDSVDTALYRPDGSQQTFPGLEPALEPGADSTVVLVEPYTLSSRTWRWLQGSSLQPLDPQPTAQQLSWSGSELAYLAGDQLVLAHPGSVRKIDLPQPKIAFTSQPGFIRLYDANAPLQVGRVDVASATLQQFSLQPPPGLRVLDSAYYAVSGFDGDGSLLTILQNDYWAALYRSGDGTSWERVGLSVTNVAAILVEWRMGGSYLLDGTNGVYVAPPTWLPAPPGNQADLSGESLQLVRPQNQFRMQVPKAAATSVADSTGRCVAYFDASSAQSQLVVMDLEHGQSTTLDIDTPQLGSQPAWLQ
jgi:hypothetical protein